MESNQCPVVSGGESVALWLCFHSVGFPSPVTKQAH